MPDFHQADGEALPVSKTDTADDTSLLPGSRIDTISTKTERIEVREYTHSLYRIGRRVFQFFKRKSIHTKETDRSVRLEAVLGGELATQTPEGKPVTLKAGQYQVSLHPELVQLFQRDSACRYFVTHYSTELLKELGIEKIVKPSRPRPLTKRMWQKIQDILHNQHSEEMRQFHYRNCIQELLELHLNNPHSLPGELQPEHIGAIYAADAIMQEDLKVHYTIPELAKKVGLNKSQLKKGFKDVFQCGVYQRFKQHRLARAKELLQTTTRTMDDIASLVGFAHRNHFINCFKQAFQITPYQWKLEEGNVSDELNTEAM